MFIWLHYSAWFLFTCVAPVLLMTSIWYKRRHSGYVMRWRKPQMAFSTILLFALNLTLFILACFFYASWMKKINGIQIVQLAEPDLKYLAFTCMLLFASVSMIYFAVQNFLTQFIVPEGILFHRFNWSTYTFERRLLKWNDIHDYYCQSDYPITVFWFLVSNADQTITRIPLGVPFYAKPRFQQILDFEMDAHQSIKSELRDLFSNIG